MRYGHIERSRHGWTLVLVALLLIASPGSPEGPRAKTPPPPAPSAGPVTPWPRPIPARLKPTGWDELMVTTLGEVKTPLANATFDPVADRLTTADGRTIEHYYRDRLEVPFYAPVDKSRYKIPPSGWCSWYYYYQEITPAEVLANARWIATNLKPYGAWFVQLDDGWQGTGHGQNDNRDWTTIDTRFKKLGMDGLARGIRDLGLEAGIWLAPHGQSNETVARDAGAFLWNEDGSTATNSWEGTYLLDPTHPKTNPYLTDLFRRLRSWGYTYFKIDGQTIVLREYAKAQVQKRMAGPLPEGKPEEVAAHVYRRTLPAIREGIGPESYLLGCWGIPLPAMGHVNGSRTGGDVVQGWDGFLIGAMALQQWNFLHNVAWYADPDVMYVRSPLTEGMARAWATAQALTGQALLTSDRLTDLPESRVEILRRVYPAVDVRPLDLYRADNILKPVMDLKVDHLGRQYDVVGVFNYDPDVATTKLLSWRALGLDPAVPHHVYDFWEGAYLGAWENGFFVEVPPAAARALTLVPARKDRPVLVSTSRHLTQGFVDLVDLKDGGTAAAPMIVGRSRVVAGDAYRLTFGVPRSKPTFRIAAVSARDESGRPLRASFANHQGYATASVPSSTSQTISWTVTFEPADLYFHPVKPPTQYSATPRGVNGAELRWHAEYNVKAGYQVDLDGVPVGVSVSPRAVLEGLTPGHTHKIGLRSVWYDGSVSREASEATFTAAVPPSLLLSELEPVYIRQNWRNIWRRLGRDASVEGRRLTVAGKAYDRGVGMHSAWDAHYDIAGAFARFTVLVGVDDETRPAKPDQPIEMLFEVWGDGRLLWKSPPIRQGQAPVPVDVAIAGVHDLTLKTLDGEYGWQGDHGDWLDARLIAAQK